MSEPQDDFAPRLDVIETQWSLVRRAHQGTIVSGTDARQALVLRYAPAIRAYVQAITRDEQITDEISQDAMVRLLQGDFAGADPGRGRFRDLLKVAVRNMVRNYWDKQKRRQGVNFDLTLLEEEHASDDSSDSWLNHWRRNVLEIAWSALEQYQQSNPGSVAYTVLRTRADFPAATSDELAEKLALQLGRELRADTFRQQLKRARTRFAEFLVEEIAHGLTETDASRIQDELICLGIYEHIKDVLPNQWKSPDSNRKA
jgi:DNA-directed RNA polymerase specialized sigma24 family protein